MSLFLRQALQAKKDKEALEAAIDAPSPQPTEAPAPTAEAPKPGSFKAKLAALAAAKNLPLPPEPVAAIEPVEVPTPKPVPVDFEALTKAAGDLTYWYHVGSKAFQSSDSGKPHGFGWKSITLDHYNKLVEANLPVEGLVVKEAEPTLPAPSAIAQAIAKAQFSLDSLYQAYLDARFTTEEADEELHDIKALLEANPALFSALAESPVPLNAKQLAAVSLARLGKSFVLTGAAGTGKTTAQAAVVDILDKEGAFGVHDFKYIGKKASIAICAFTKVAVRNIQKAIRKNPRIKHYADHCMTIHSLLEFEPEAVDRVDEQGSTYTTKMFMPQRHSGNPLGITHLIIEEASMVGLDLWMQLYDAMLAGIQIIFLGDINQLQPVFAKPILGYALLKLPVIELTRVYRQALDSPVIANAHRVLKGLPIQASPCGKVAVIPGKSETKVGQSKMGLAMKIQFRKMWEAGFYDPDQDIILLPWNKQAMGTKEINETVASFLGAARDALVYHVKANRTQWYLAVGDRVLVDKRAGVITAIRENPKYIGGATKPAGFYTRDGTPILGGGSTVDFDAVGADEIDYSNFSMEDVETDEGKRASSHVVTVEYSDTEGATGDLTSAGHFADSNFQFGYAMTCHKAQGSEFRRVFMCLHHDHLSFVGREFMYTGLTRAREEFIIFAKYDLIERACLKQDVKGDSLADKIEYFNSGALADLDMVPVEKLVEDEPEVKDLSSVLAKGGYAPSGAQEWLGQVRNYQEDDIPF